jgi:hypothetical protein
MARSAMIAIVRVNDVGDIHRRAAGTQVRRGLQVHDLTVRARCRLVHVALREHAFRRRVQGDARQDLLVADAAARVLVDASTSSSIVEAIADHMRRHALGRRDELAADHQQAVIQALEVGLDDHAVAVLLGLVVGLFELLLVADVRGHAAAVVGVQRLQHHRVADALRRPDRPPQPVDQRLARHGQAEIAEYAVGLVLLRGQLHGDVRRLAGDRGLQPPLVAAVAELDQAVVVEADPGYVRASASFTSAWVLGPRERDWQARMKSSRSRQNRSRAGLRRVAGIQAAGNASGPGPACPPRSPANSSSYSNTMS